MQENQSNPDSQSDGLWRELLLMVLPCLLIFVQFHSPLPTRLAQEFSQFWLSRPPRWIANLIHSAPVIIFLVAGCVVARKRKYPCWSYPWMGFLFFFAYREVFAVVLKLAPLWFPEAQKTVVGVFYLLATPLALALFLLLISLKDWLMAALAIYPYTSILMAWYTLDSTPSLILAVSLLAFTGSLYVFLKLHAAWARYLTLCAGTLIMTAVFFGWIGEWDSGIICTIRNLLIILFPAGIHFAFLMLRKLRGLPIESKAPVS